MNGTNGGTIPVYTLSRVGGLPDDRGIAILSIQINLEKPKHQQEEVLQEEKEKKESKVLPKKASKKVCKTKLGCKSRSLLANKDNAFRHPPEANEKPCTLRKIQFKLR